MFAAAAVGRHYNTITMFDETPLGPLSDEYVMMSQQTPQEGEPLVSLLERILEDREPTDIELQQLSDVELAMYSKIREKKTSGKYLQLHLCQTH